MEKRWSDISLGSYPCDLVRKLVSVRKMFSVARRHEELYFVGAADNTELTGDICGERRRRSDMYCDKYNNYVRGIWLAGQAKQSVSGTEADV
jgi:hypothetical protein